VCCCTTPAEVSKFLAIDAAAPLQSQATAGLENRVGLMRFVRRNGSHFAGKSYNVRAQAAVISDVGCLED
jgi:hypothetical protein